MRNGRHLKNPKIRGKCMVVSLSCLLFSGFPMSTIVWPTALKLGYITNFDMLVLVKGFISLVDEIQFMLISSRSICIKPWLNRLASGRKSTQVFDLRFNLRWLALTLVELQFTDASGRRGFTVWPPNARRDKLIASHQYMREVDLRIHLATQRKSVRKFWFCKLASAYIDFFGQGLRKWSVGTNFACQKICATSLTSFCKLWRHLRLHAPL